MPATLRDSAPLRLILRHRRIAAACLIGIAAFLALDAIPTRVIEAPRPSIPSPAAGEVIVPISLADPTASAVLASGDVVSLVLTDDSGYAQVLSDHARVRTVIGGGIGSSGSGAISVVVRRDEALRLASAPARGSLSVLIQPGS